MNQVCGRRGGGGGGDHKNGPSFPHTCPTFTTFGQQPIHLEITFAHSVHLVGKLPGFTPVHPLNLAGQWPPHVVRKVGPSNTWLTSHVDLPTFTQVGPCHQHLVQIQSQITCCRQLCLSLSTQKNNLLLNSFLMKLGLATMLMERIS